VVSSEEPSGCRDEDGEVDVWCLVRSCLCVEMRMGRYMCGV
jgi:hypothetical protein